MTFLDLLIYSLACFRLALLFSKESGPARIFAKLRRLPPPKSSAREGLSCPLCLAMWFSGVLMTCYSFRDHQPWIEPFFVWPLAVSAGAVILNQSFTKGSL